MLVFQQDVRVEHSWATSRGFARRDARAPLAISVVANSKDARPRFLCSSSWLRQAMTASRTVCTRFAANFPPRPGRRRLPLSGAAGSCLARRRAGVDENLVRADGERIEANLERASHRAADHPVHDAFGAGQSRCAIVTEQQCSRSNVRSPFVTVMRRRSASGAFTTGAAARATGASVPRRSGAGDVRHPLPSSRRSGDSSMGPRLSDCGRPSNPLTRKSTVSVREKN